MFDMSALRYSDCKEKYLVSFIGTREIVPISEEL